VVGWLDCMWCAPSARVMFWSVLCPPPSSLLPTIVALRSLGGCGPFTARSVCGFFSRVQDDFVLIGQVGGTGFGRNVSMLGMGGGSCGALFPLPESGAVPENVQDLVGQ